MVGGSHPNGGRVSAHRPSPSAFRWFCHVDDDNYVNPESLLHLLSTFSSNQDVYLGRPSLDHPIEATERVQGGGTVSAGLTPSLRLTQ